MKKVNRLNKWDLDNLINFTSENMLNCLKEQKTYEVDDTIRCNRCNSIVRDSDLKDTENEYVYQCDECYEDLYTFETYVKHSSLWHLCELRYDNLLSTLTKLKAQKEDLK